MANLRAIDTITSKMVDELRLSKRARRVSDRDIAYGRARMAAECLEALTGESADEQLRAMEEALKDWDS